MLDKWTLIFGLMLVISALVVTFYVIAENAPKGPQEYIACGCGCCTYDEPLWKIAEVQCLNKSAGDSINKIISDDQVIAQSSGCHSAPCKEPVLYKYCD